MAVETAADLAVFFDTDDFGVACSYTLAAGGGPTTVNGILEREYVDLSVDVEVDIASSGPAFMCAETDLPSGYGAGDTLVIDSVTYKAREPQPDGTGVITIRLEET